MGGDTGCSWAAAGILCVHVVAAVLIEMGINVDDEDLYNVFGMKFRQAVVCMRDASAYC